MQLSDIANIRLHSQHILQPHHNTVKEVVGFMGALQAQDYSMMKWAVGTRLPKVTEQAVEASINKAEILRTHLLRPTWHLVSADDIYWMLELTAPHVKKILHARDRNLELTSAIYNKSNALIEKALRDHNHLTREEIMFVLHKAKIDTDENRSSHLMMHAELEGLVCNGSIKNKKQTYALLSERVKQPKSITRDEALAKLAERYFTSHGPATLQDFVWWSGLSVKDARHALELVQHKFISEQVAAESYWFSSRFSSVKKTNSAHLLPAYDEFIISYKKRNATLTIEHQKKAFSTNGIFRPVVLVNGEGVGLWKRSLVKDKVHIETELFKSITPSMQLLLEKEMKAFGVFLDKSTSLHR